MGSAYDFRKGPNPGTREAKPVEKGKNGGGNPGRLRSARVEVAENGYTVHCEQEPPKQKPSKDGKDAPMSYEPPKPYVFETASAALKFLAGKLGA